MFDRSPIPTVRPGRAASPAPAIDRLRDAAARGSRDRPGGGLLGIETPGGLPTRKPGPPTFHAQLSGTANPYTFVEVYGVNSPALWATLPGGRSGGDAYAMNGTTGLDNRVVELTPVGGGAWYRFNWKSKARPGSGAAAPDCFGCTAPDQITTATLTYSLVVTRFESPGEFHEPTDPTMTLTGTMPYSGSPGSYVGAWTPWPGYSQPGGYGGYPAALYYRMTLAGCDFIVEFASDTSGSVNNVGNSVLCPSVGSSISVNCSPFTYTWSNSPCSGYVSLEYNEVDPVFIAYLLSGVVTQ